MAVLTSGDGVAVGAAVAAGEEDEPPQAVARAMEDALVYEAFSSEYIANLVEQRARFTPEASALHLTRRGDLLDVSLAPPDLSIYHATPPPQAPDSEEGPHHG